MGKISLKNMPFYAHHGVYKEETALGNKFVVSVDMYGDFSKAAQSDNLRDSADYVAVYNLVKEEMGNPSQLLEHLVNRINQKVMNNFAQIDKIETCVCKENPPLNGLADSVCYTQISQR